MADLYPGAAALVTSDSWPNLFCVALDVVLSGPTAWADVEPHILPYGSSPLIWIGDGELYAQESLRLLDGYVQFTHPGDAGPLTALSLAVSYTVDESWLVALVAIDAPAPTSQPGDMLTVPVTLVVLADPSSGG